MNTSNIIIALEIMAKGMAGIFTAILIIILCVWLLGKIGKEILQYIYSASLFIPDKKTSQGHMQH